MIYTVHTRVAVKSACTTAGESARTRIDTLTSFIGVGHVTDSPVRPYHSQLVLGLVGDV